MWSYDAREDPDSSDRSGSPVLLALALHPDGGFVTVVWASRGDLVIRRFDRDWNRLWRTLLPTGDIPPHPRYGRHVELQVLSGGAMVLKDREMLVVLEADGNLRQWIPTNGFGFDGIGSVIAYGDDLLIGGTGNCGGHIAGSGATLCAALARIDRDGRLLSSMGFAVMSEAVAGAYVPAAALPLPAGERFAALAGCSVFATTVGNAESLVFRPRGRLETWPCRSSNRLRLLEYNRTGQLVRSRVVRDRPLAGRGGMIETLPAYVLAAAPASLTGEHGVPASRLYWLDARAADVARLAVRATGAAGAAVRRHGAVAEIPAVAAASDGGTTLILLRRAADEARPGTAPAASHHVLMAVAPTGAAIVDERRLPAMSGVRLAPAAGFGYGIAGLQVVRFALTRPAP